MTEKAGIIRNASRNTSSLALLLACFMACNAMAAKDSVVECDELVQSKQNLMVAIEGLSVNVVEHIDSDPNSNNSSRVIRSLDQHDIDVRTDAPVLSLSPRVATMLDKIFAVEETTLESSKTDSSVPTSPVADGQAKKAALQDSQESDFDDKLRPPEMQSQMYRRDI